MGVEISTVPALAKHRDAEANHGPETVEAYQDAVVFSEESQREQ